MVAAVAKHRSAYQQIFVLYADCGTGGQLLEKCKELGVEMLQGPHCYSFFEGNEVFAAKSESEFTAFYLTDFLVRQFDAFVWKPMGLDRHPELRDMYFGNYTKLVYQAQTNDPRWMPRPRTVPAGWALPMSGALPVTAILRRKWSGWRRPEVAKPHSSPQRPIGKPGPAANKGA